MQREHQKLPAASADNINEAHRLAKSMAESAVEHAIQCGRLLLARKKLLSHGDLQSWIEENCSFGYSTAGRYMSAAKNNARGVAFSSLRELFPSGRTKRRALPPPEKSITSEQISTAVVISTPAPPAARASPTERPKPSQATAAAAKKEPAPEDGAEPDADEISKAEAIECELNASVDKIMKADDKLAAAYEEIKRQAAEVAALKISRDGFMNGKAEMTRLLKKEQAKNLRLIRENEQLVRENHGLKQRVA